MMLIPDASQPGLWVNPEWQSGSSGTFAVIIGVSQYDHLLGGRGDRATSTYGLNQLFVSALTAYQFFRWLTEKYQYDGSPLAECWLLLSPTSEELAAQPALAQHQLLPTFDNCKNAIRRFFRVMQQLSTVHAEKSRAFFFFTGHGLEITKNQQILLPCDYLNPANFGLNDAISTANLWDGMSVLDIPDQFFFLDACRNDQQQLREKQIKGADILDTSLARYTAPNVNAPLFYASAAGTQAWQPTVVTDGTSLFGRALLEGLEAQAKMQIDRTMRPWAVQIAPLQKYTKLRVQELLKERGATVNQHVMFGGSYCDPFATVTQIVGEETTRSPQSQRDGDLPNWERSWLDSNENLPPSKGVDSRGPLFPTDAKFMYGPPRELYGWNPARQGMHFTFNLTIVDMHDVMGSERVTALWHSVRVYSFARRNWLSSAEDYAIVRIRRNETRSYLIELALLHNEGAHWLEISDSENTFACVLPGDRAQDSPTNPVYLLEMDWSGDRILRLSASLSPDNEELLGEMAQRWEQYQDGNFSEALQGLDTASFYSAMQLKSPLVLTIAGIILLRSRRPSESKLWLSSLVHRCADRPDSLVLWVEQLFQESATSAATEIVGALMDLCDHGLPQTSEGFGYAVKQVEAVLRLTSLDDFQREQMEQLQQRLQKALPFFRTGGLFSTFAGRKGELSPELVSR